MENKRQMHFVHTKKDKKVSKKKKRSLEGITHCWTFLPASGLHLWRADQYLGQTQIDNEVPWSKRYILCYFWCVRNCSTTRNARMQCTQSVDWSFAYCLILHLIHLNHVILLLYFKRSTMHNLRTPYSVIYPKLIGPDDVFPLFTRNMHFIF